MWAEDRAVWTKVARRKGGVFAEVVVTFGPAKGWAGVFAITAKNKDLHIFHKIVLAAGWAVLRVRPAPDFDENIRGLRPAGHDDLVEALSPDVGWLGCWGTA